MYHLQSDQSSSFTGCKLRVVLLWLHQVPLEFDLAKQATAWLSLTTPPKAKSSFPSIKDLFGKTQFFNKGKKDFSAFLTKDKNEILPWKKKLKLKDFSTPLMKDKKEILFQKKKY